METNTVTMGWRGPPRYKKTRHLKGISSFGIFPSLRSWNQTFRVPTPIKYSLKLDYSSKAWGIFSFSFPLASLILSCQEYAIWHAKSRYDKGILTYYLFNQLIYLQGRTHVQQLTHTSIHQSSRVQLIKAGVQGSSMQNKAHSHLCHLSIGELAVVEDY
jgi:hypothetical protein